MSIFGLDIETRGLEASWSNDTEVLCFSVYTEEGGIESGWFLWTAENIEYLVSLCNEHIPVFHNSAFDVPALRRRNVPVGHNVSGTIRFHDSMLIAYCWNSTQYSYSLDSLAPLVGEKKVRVAKEDWETITAFELKERNLGDARASYKLFKHFSSKFEYDPEGYQNYLDIELPYVENIIQMQTVGVNIDEPSLTILRALAEAEVHRAQEEALSISPWKIEEPVTYANKEPISFRERVRKDGKTVSIPDKWVSYKILNGVKTYEHCPLTPTNLNSQDQVADVLFRLYNWKPERFSRKTEKPTCDSDALEEEGSPFSKAVLKFREYDKLLSTYILPIERKFAEYGVVRGRFNQCITSTHRLSSSEPNLQNIPVRSSDFRKVFIPREGYTFLCGDLDRIEVCVLGFYLELLYGSKTLSDAVRQGIDVHQVNADLWGIQRSVAKNTFFCILYGGAAERIAKTAGIPLAQAEKILSQIEEKLPELLYFREDAADTYKRQQVLHDWFGARLKLPKEDITKGGELKASGKRKIGNYIVQCPAGQVFKMMQNQFFEQNLEGFVQDDVHLLIVVHDECVYEVRSDKVDYYQKALNETFSDNTVFSTDDFYVPVRAEFNPGHTWLEAKS